MNQHQSQFNPQLRQQLKQLTQPKPKPERLPVVIRPYYAPNDIAYVYDSWLRNQLPSKATRKQQHLFFNAQKPIIDKILADPNTKVLIASHEEDPNSILAWLCVGKVDHIPVVHFCATKAIYRRLGLQRLLFEHSGMTTPIIATHTSWIVKELKGKHEVMVL